MTIWWCWGKIPCADGRIPMSDGAGEVTAVGDEKAVLIGNLERDPALFQMQEGDLVKMADSLRPASRMVAPTGRHERASIVRELCGNAFQKTPVTTERRARGCASFCGFYRQESVAVGASRGLITQRSLVQIQPPQPTDIR